MQSKSLSNIAEKLKKENVLLTLSVLFITCVFTPYLYWGEDTHLFVLDNMEANLTWVKMVLDAGGLLPPNAIIKQVMNGIPLAGVYGTYDINLLLFNALGNLGGFATSKYLIAIIGFFGMYFLLKHFILSKIPIHLPAMIALLFSLLPFWSFTASVAGIPFVLFAFLNLRNGKKGLSNWFILIFYAFYSSLILTGVFILLILSSLFLYDIWRNKKINFLFLIGLTCLSTAYVISHLPLFVNNLDPNFVSVREEFTRIQNLTPFKAIKNTLTVFFDGNDYLYQTKHALGMQRYFIIPTALLSLILMIKRNQTNKLYIGILLFICITSLAYSAYEMQFFYPIRLFFMSILPINLTRIYWLHPTCWYLILAISCGFLYKNYQWGKYYIIVLFLSQLIYTIPYQDHFYYKYKNKSVSYADFFAVKQFTDIKLYIGKKTDEYRVLNIGIHPTIALHNGFYTLDGYMVNYPLSYKHQFRKIIAGELNRSKYRTEDFDKWGGRCYAWSSEIVDEANYTTTEFPEIQHLDFDYNQLKLMGGEYIISNAKINTEINTSLKFLKNFKQSDYEHSHWNIYLYKVL